MTGQYAVSNFLIPLIQPEWNRGASPIREMSGMRSAILLKMISSSAFARLAPRQ
ncbi:Uncharacterised protein [Mycobacteroides abscessus subsp. abscessus]|nr:Uncharacterised protein [Mycobacteroides abscessus subsp. abscessus]SKU84640.1 Uncharacterised protein [Mycobacteroides abscessus subsp. abscessus]